MMLESVGDVQTGFETYLKHLCIYIERESNWNSHFGQATLPPSRLQWPWAPLWIGCDHTSSLGTPQCALSSNLATWAQKERRSTWFWSKRRCPSLHPMRTIRYRWSKFGDWWDSCGWQASTLTFLSRCWWILHLYFYSLGMGTWGGPTTKG